MNSLPKFARNSAVAGAVVWLALFLVRLGESPETALIQRMVLLGVLVIVPLGLSLIATLNDSGAHSFLYRWAVIVQPPGAVAAVVSFFAETGWLAALLAMLWLIESMLIALFGLLRVLRRGLYPVEEFSVDAGLLYLPVAGVSLVVSRLGIQPFGFGDTIILLTAVHFHFAGFAAPVIAGMAGRLLRRRTHPRVLFRLSVAGIVGSMPLIAAGITFAPVLALTGTILISVGLMLLALLTIGWVLPSVESFPSQLLLAISSLSSCSAMVLACLYAYSILAKTVIFDIPTMAMSHGVVNAFGFATCGLVAWTIIKPPTTL